MTFAAAIGMAVSAPVSFAQETQKPLDLTVLSTSEDNVSFVIIEEADDTQIAQIAEDNDTTTRLADEADSVPADNQSRLADTLTQQTAQRTDEAAANSPDETSDESLESVAAEDGATAITGRMTRRTVKDVGLASIGIGNHASASLDALDNRLWRGIDLPRAMRLIEAVPVPVSSDALRRMSYHVIARQAVPPKGAAEDPTALLSARISYLARVGRSEGLAAIITQLPENEAFAEWHNWKLFYDLMMRDDEKACAKAKEEASTSLDPLWQKTNLMCQILTGDEVRAAFSADVLKASGLIDDPLYFDLIDVLLRRRAQDSIVIADTDEAQIDLMHLILMDAAHVTIGAPALALLDKSYAEAANGLRYLGDDARQSLGLTNFRAGLISQAEAKNLFIASTQAPDTPLMAMARRLEADDSQSDSAAVMLYLAIAAAADAAKSLSQEDATELAMLTLSAISTEVERGDGTLWVPLYAPYLQQVMAELDMTQLAPALQSDYAMVMAVSGLPLAPLPTDGRAVVTADHVAIAYHQTAPIGGQIDSLSALGQTQLLPLVTGSAQGERDWLTDFTSASQQSDIAYQPLSQTGLQALSQAAAKGQRAEAVIVAAMVVSDRALDNIHPLDIATLADSLTRAGLPETAKAIIQEARQAHLMTSLLAGMGGSGS